MEKNNKEWLRPNPELTLFASIIPLSDIPFSSILVTKPVIEFNKISDILEIKDVVAFSTVILDYINGSNSNIAATYNVVYSKDKSETGLSGNLIWDEGTKTWGASGVAVSSLDLTLGYVVKAYFNDYSNRIIGQSPPSNIFYEEPPSTVITTTTVETKETTIGTSTMKTSETASSSIVATLPGIVPGFTIIPVIILIGVVLIIKRRKDYF
jgi:hypothetical protein